MAWYNKLAVCAVIATTLIFAAVDAQSDEYLTPHNAARSDVGVGPLVWDDTLQAYAQDYANSQAGQCLPLTHSGGPYGENLYWSSGAASPGDAVAAWVSEKQYYDYNSNTCAAGEECGHYTQVVWRNTTNLGCASVTCSDGGTYIICSYNPPGNYVGERPY